MAFGLMTSHTGGVIHLVATGNQLVQRPVFAGQLFELRGLGLALGEPGVVVGFGFNVDHNGHKAVVFAAQLSALPAIEAGLFNAGPGFVDEAGDRVTLDGKGWHPP